LKYYTSSYKWEKVKDANAIAAYDTASKAQDTADGKRRVFTDTPYTPYDKGDLWVKQEGEKTTLYYSIADKAKGQPFAESDWLIGATDDTAIKDLQIGGTNLLVGTNQGVNNWSFSSSISTYTTKEISYNGALGVQIIKNNPMESAGWEIIKYPLRSELIKKDKKYHLTFDFMQSAENDIELGVLVSLNNSNGNNPLTNVVSLKSKNIGGIWQHFDVEFTAFANGNKNNGRIVYFNIQRSTNEWKDLAIANLKLEEGNKATTWSPSPEDVESALILLETETTAKIEKLDDKITQSVTETKEYVDGTKEELESKITTEVGKVSLSVEDTKTDVNGVKTNLSRTGIDIEKRKIVVTANDFTIKNNNDKIVASADQFGNWSTNTLITLNDDGTKAITINEKGNRILTHYYPYTNQRQLEEGWNGTSLFRYFDENGVMLWQIGGAKGFMDADHIEWTAVGLYDTKFDMDIESVEGQLKRFISIGDVKLGTYYQHNVLGASAKMYKTRGTESPINGWFTNETSWYGKESSDDPILKRGFRHYTNGEVDWAEYIAWDPRDEGDVWIIKF
jgi:hypothetical protein